MRCSMACILVMSRPATPMHWRCTAFGDIVALFQHFTMRGGGAVRAAHTSLVFP